MHWEELSRPQIERLDRDRTAVLLPLGSVEQHGRHMPLGTDTMLAVSVARGAAARLDGQVVILPPPWYGLSAHHMRFAGTITLSTRTMLALVEDIAASLAAHGFRRFLMVNGHAGNRGGIDVLAAELGHRFHGTARVACITYFDLAREAIAALRRSQPGGMAHAGEFETSMMLHLRPELVDMDEAETTYADTGSKYLTIDLLGAPSVHTYHDFGDLSPSGTLGDPSLAEALRGADFYNAVVDSLARFIEDFLRWPIAGRPDPPPTASREA